MPSGVHGDGLQQSYLLSAKYVRVTWPLVASWFQIWAFGHDFTKLVCVNIQAPRLTEEPVPQNWVVLENVIVRHSTLSVCCGARKFITVFKRLPHRSLPSARLIQSRLSNPVSLRSISILSTSTLKSSNDLFLSGFPVRMVYAFLVSPCTLHAPPILCFLMWAKFPSNAKAMFIIS
jgi:hypothetical protein